ncbi:MAG TPA: type II secretion system F family protein [Pirellulales bacterium]|nr:type II secretion system F family protein [Pirellulales bacterium]
MSPGLLALLTFWACASAVVGVYSLLSDLFLQDRERVRKRMSEAFRSQQHERAKASLLVKKVGAAEEKTPDEGPQLKLTFADRLQTLLDQSGLQLGLNRLLAICAGISAIAGVAGGLLQRSAWVAMTAAIIGLPLPLVYVQSKRNRRMEALRRQLSDSFDLMARILRAGQSMTQAMRGVADEFPSPIAEEFAFSSEQMNLGLSPEISLRALARRTGLIELNIFVVAVLVQRQVGGNLSEILEKLAEVVRQRYRIRGVIRGLTAEGRLQALILMALPPLLLALMLIVNRDYARLLLERPILLVGMGFFMALGALWIRKVVNFDF